MTHVLCFGDMRKAPLQSLSRVAERQFGTASLQTLKRQSACDTADPGADKTLCERSRAMVPRFRFCQCIHQHCRVRWVAGPGMDQACLPQQLRPQLGHWPR